MKISKTTSTFFGMLLLMLAAMFYSEIATAAPEQAKSEYHAVQMSNSGFMGAAIAAPLGIGVMCLAVFTRYSRKAGHSNKHSYLASLQAHKKLTGDGDDEEEITAFGGGVAFRS